MICIIIWNAFHVLGCCSRLLPGTWNHDLHCYLQCIPCFGVLLSAPPQNLKSWFALLFATHFMVWGAVFDSFPEPKMMVCVAICSAFHVLGAVRGSSPQAEIMMCIVICNACFDLRCCSRLRSWNHDLHCYLQCISCFGVLFSAPPQTWNHHLHGHSQCNSCFGVLFSAPPQNLSSWFALLLAMHGMFLGAVLGSTPPPEIVICIVMCNAFHVSGCCSRHQNLKLSLHCVICNAFHVLGCCPWLHPRLSISIHIWSIQ